LERVRQSPDTRARLHLLTGFLGSGKTTLLRRHLASRETQDVAVLVNEFGAVSLDDGLIGVSDDVVEVLASGCLCCTVLNRLGQALRALIAKRKKAGLPVRDVIIETSGLACPEPILNTIRSDYVLDEYLQIGAIVAVLDCRDADHVLPRYREAARQLCAADRIVLTKADLVDGQRVERVRAMARAINPFAAIDVATESTAFVPRLFERGDDGARVSPQPDRSASHEADFRSIALTYRSPLDWARFSLWLTSLLNRHGRSVLRFKGILQVHGHAQAVVIHSVQHLMYPPRHLRHLPRGQTGSALVFIVDGLEPDRIAASLDHYMGQIAMPLAA
jgi:G3E family GTPase